jgi:N-carbamoylputrescine amidase
LGVAMTNYAAPQNNGHSVAFDAVAFPLKDVEAVKDGEAVEDGEARDTLIVEAGESEDVYLATFDMDSIRAYRAREAWGNAYRRPRLYKMLTATEVHPPFIRPDATR